MAVQQRAPAGRIDLVDEGLRAEVPAWAASSFDECRELKHEIGNALTAASAYSQLILRRAPDWVDDSDRRALEAIHQSVLRAQSMLLQIRPAPQSCDLRSTVARCVDEVLPERRRDVVVHDPVESLVGPWEEPRVAQIVVNLLSNAVKYSPPGSSIEVELSRQGDSACVSVRDHGIGIAPDELEGVFRGYRTAEARVIASGSGLGLGLSRRLARAEGGRLWAESTPGRGSSFHLELPLVR